MDGTQAAAWTALQWSPVLETGNTSPATTPDAADTGCNGARS